MPKNTPYTPGPWEFDPEYDAFDMRLMAVGPDAANLPVAHVESWCDDNPEERERALANGRLIAAAPELLEALQEVLADVDAGNLENPSTSRWPKAHAVVDKALGHQNNADDAKHVNPGYNPRQGFDSVAEAVGVCLAQPDPEQAMWDTVKANYGLDEIGFASELLREFGYAQQNLS